MSAAELDYPIVGLKVGGRDVGEPNPNFRSATRSMGSHLAVPGPVRSSIGRGSRPWLLEYRAGCVTPC